MILGNIITNDDIEELSIFKYYTFDNLMGIDENLPTLYIGYTNTKKLLGNINALSHTITDNKFWCNTKKENSKVFVKEYFLFQIYVHNYFIKNIEYIYYDVFESISYHKKHLKILNDNINKLKCVWSSIDMLYISFDETIYGISYNALKFIGVSPKKLKRKIDENVGISLLYKNLNNEIKRFCLITNSEMYSAYLLNFS